MEPFSKYAVWPKSFAKDLRARRGWQRALIAFGFGLLTALAFPPVNLTPVLWISFPALIYLLDGTDKLRQAFVTGWCFAFGSFLLGLYWIADSMFVDIRHFWWAVPLAVAGLPAFFAIYYGCAAVLSRFAGQGIAGILGFVLSWFLADYARGHLFSGFPWDFSGYAWTAVLPMLQVTSLIGIYGLTLLTLLAASFFALLASPKPRQRQLAVLVTLYLVLVAGWGSWRLSQDQGLTVPGVRLRLVQPNIDQAHKWAEGEQIANFSKLLLLSSEPSTPPITHLVWPETASTYYLTEDIPHRQDVAGIIPHQGALITGVIRREPVPGGGRPHHFNSLITIDDHGRVIGEYDKFHLVPFGEFIPLRHYLPLPTLVNQGFDFSSGDGPHSLRVPGLPPFSPMICYEAIFPGAEIDAADRPGLLVNVTNDGWYGATAGPYQHFAIARVRAIEEGLPLVRAANTGISGIVDSYGRVTERLGIGLSGFVDGDLPKALPPTFFHRFGELPLWSLFFILAAAMVYLRSKEISRAQGRN